MNKHEELTQRFSTWGDKLLQHTDVLCSIQKDHKFKPITVQIALTETCSSDCPFCSLAGRPLKSYIPFEKVYKVFKDFALLGAKSVEITGGGEPLLYYDKDAKKNINDVIHLAHSFNFDVGIITNTNDLKYLDKDTYSKIKFLRISLIKLDEGKSPEDYKFYDFPLTKLGFSYIIYETGGVPDELSRTGKAYQGTTMETIDKIARLVNLYPQIKFVRIAGNCLIRGVNAKVKEKYQGIVDAVDRYGKMFIKDIEENDIPYEDFCAVGLIRPYIAPSPKGGDYQVYACTSYVLQKRTYDLDYSLGSIDNILDIWEKANKRYKETGYPYEIKGNKGCGWSKTCEHCFYYNNNKLLNTVAHELPDKNFA